MDLRVVQKFFFLVSYRKTNILLIKQEKFGQT